MSYSTDYRKRTIEYREEGHTLEETQKIFKVAISTIRTWEKQWKEQGTLNPAPVVRLYKKINPEKQYQRYADMEALPDEAIADLLDRVTVWPDGRLEVALKFFNELPVSVGVEVGKECVE